MGARAHSMSTEFFDFGQLDAAEHQRERRCLEHALYTSLFRTALPSSVVQAEETDVLEETDEGSTEPDLAWHAAPPREKPSKVRSNRSLPSTTEKQPKAHSRWQSLVKHLNARAKREAAAGARWSAGRRNEPRSCIESGDAPSRPEPAAAARAKDGSAQARKGIAVGVVLAGAQGSTPADAKDRPQPASSGWTSLLGKLLHRDDEYRVVPRSRACRRRTALPIHVRRWTYLHGPQPVQRSAEILPREFTMCHQINAMDKLAQERLERQQEQRWRSKWTSWAQRWLSRSVLRSWASCVRPATEAKRREAARREAAKGWGAAATNGWESAASADADAIAAASLGVDVATYRLLQELQRRDIRPEDYDLLGRLDESVKPKTLCSEQLSNFPTEIYEPMPCGGVLSFGLDFWSLPLPSSLPDDEVSCGFDFWRLPLNAEVEDEKQEEHRETAVSESSLCDVCPVCCVDFESGDVLRKLEPCGHRFHRSCIDRWLLESSTTCPVDKRELVC